MRLPFECSFCEASFEKFEEYKTHLSTHPPIPPWIGTPLPHSIASKHLKCESCAFKWLDITTDSELFLSSYENKNLCSVCIGECEQRKNIITKYSDYFEKVTTMWEIRFKELYVKSYHKNIQCCLCNSEDSYFHYSLATYENHRICRLCIEKEWKESGHDKIGEYDLALLTNCDCYSRSMID
jgi:hypothetical protein